MGGDDVIKNRIYIGRLPERTRESDLERFLRGYGDIKEIRLMTGYAFVEFEEERDAEDAVYELNGKSVNGESVNVDYATVPRMTGRARSPGYSSRRRYDDDDRGGRYNNRRNGGGYGGGRDRDRYEKYDDRNRRPAGSQGYYGPLNKSPYRVIVKNLSVAVSWQDLKDFMRKAGEVTFTAAHQQRRNEGVAEFANKDSLERALDELDGSEIHGMKIRLYRDRDGDEEGSRSRSRSNSKSRSRSRSPKKSKKRSGTKSKSPEEKRSNEDAGGDNDSDKSGYKGRSRSRSGSRN